MLVNTKMSEIAEYLSRMISVFPEEEDFYIRNQPVHFDGEVAGNSLLVTAKYEGHDEKEIVFTLGDNALYSTLDSSRFSLKFLLTILVAYFASWIREKYGLESKNPYLIIYQGDELISVSANADNYSVLIDCSQL